MFSPQIISSLFDLIKELFNSGNNRKKKTKWIVKVTIAMSILTIGICFIIITMLTKELYSAQLELKQLRLEVLTVEELRYENRVLQSTNNILAETLRKYLPDNKELIIPDNDDGSSIIIE
jgi:hypothetical protein